MTVEFFFDKVSPIHDHHNPRWKASSPIRQEMQQHRVGNLSEGEN